MTKDIVSEEIEPGLFGLKNTNRDLKDKNSWGKNQFNNAFPTALANYMFSKNLEPVYLKLGDDLKVNHTNISVESLFGMNPANVNTFFAFESTYTPYQRFAEGSVPRADLVTVSLGANPNDDKIIKGLEIKLTALPDQTTFELNEENYSCEIVIRPDTIVYLGYSMASIYHDKRKELFDILDPVCNLITDWSNSEEILPHLANIVLALDTILLSNLDNQVPIVMQPIWKTIGKAPRLAENCLDLFVWSNFAFTRLFIDPTKKFKITSKITRQVRTSIWFCKMLYDYSKDGKINHMEIINDLTYNTKNDKAFSAPGTTTHQYLHCEELTKPRITINEIQNIILGGGEKFLSPERRFDAVIVSAPGLFD
ncbi:MAG: HindVP family restriction endonuclease [Carnobacterium sp.]|uniref:HindVP family restriction endonuclease n=1 Tax=Carnobacterium sp. TaxID=48221 RepID=UPI003C70B522